MIVISSSMYNITIMTNITIHIKTHKKILVLKKFLIYLFYVVQLTTILVYFIYYRIHQVKTSTGYYDNFHN